jgi:hypothetical protein
VIAHVEQYLPPLASKDDPAGDVLLVHYFSFSFIDNPKEQAASRE